MFSEFCRTASVLSSCPTDHQRRAAAHRDVEVHAALVFVVADEDRLHPNVRHVNGPREEEEDGKAREQQADQDGRGHIQLPVDTKQEDSTSSSALWMEIVPNLWPAVD